MVDVNYTHDNMPNCLQIYAHNPIDVLSLDRHNWLTGSIRYHRFKYC